MLGKLIPILLALTGLGAGIGGGLALRPEPVEIVMTNPCGDVAHDAGHNADAAAEEEDHDSGSFDYVKLNNQFVIPVVAEGKVAALVVMSLSLEVAAGETENIYQMEPKLRDMFLRVMFDHANAGGFSGEFTKTTRMNSLRKALREAAQKTLGPMVSDVLIIDVVRQDA